MSHLRNRNEERTYKSIIFEVLPEAIAAERSVTGRIDMRGLFYACRRLYLAHPERPFGREAYYAERKKSAEHILEYPYFNNQLIPEYEQEHGEIQGLVRKGVGQLYEAHTLNTDAQGVGTEFVARFEPPPYYYDKVLYVEKDGIARGLVDQDLGRRYDMAVIASQGYRTEADGVLLRRFSEEGYQVLILHDCDIDGFGILANLRDGNARVRALVGEAIDLGMRLSDARQMGLLGEEATRQKAIPTNTAAYLTDEELELFTGMRRNAKVWEYTRFELNEIPADERLPFVERKLREAGVRPKVIPPDDYLGDAAAWRRDSHIEAEVDLAIGRVLDVDEIKAALVERFKDRYDLSDIREHVERGLEARPRSSWRGVLGRRIAAQGRALGNEIEAAVRAEIEAAISPDDVTE